jgi:glycosyltransferase involved in cell wall biosynthesis
MPNLTIGIPARNEGKSICRMIASLYKAVKCLPKNIKFETIVCLNGNIDDSKEKLAKLETDIVKHLNLKVIRSAPGKIKAEQKIIKIRNLHGWVLFCDADIILHKKSIKRLCEALIKDNKLKAVSAKVYPILTRRRKDNFYQLLKDYYAMRTKMPVRNCIHGRMFLIRDAKDLDIVKSTEKVSGTIRKKLFLDKGPIADDIIYTAQIAYKYGLQSIKRLVNAKVYFYPPDSLYDLFLSNRRYTLEIERINTLYPEYRNINNKDYAKKTKIERFILFKKRKISAEIFMEFEQFLGKLVKLYEVSGKTLNLWEPVKSSKK